MIVIYIPKFTQVHMPSSTTLQKIKPALPDLKTNNFWHFKVDFKMCLPEQTTEIFHSSTCVQNLGRVCQEAFRDFIIKLSWEELIKPNSGIMKLFNLCVKKVIPWMYSSVPTDIFECFQSWSINLWYLCWINLSILLQSCLYEYAMTCFKNLWF